MLDRLLAWMRGEGIDAAFVSDPVSIAYLSGFRAEPHERLMALVIRDEEAALVVPGLEEESAVAASRVPVRAWRDGEDPWVPVLAALGANPARLAVEKSHLTLGAWERLRSLVAAAGEPLDLSPQLRRLRVRKLGEEVVKLERAARITDEVTAELLSSLAEGQSELEVASRVALLLAEAGAQPSFETIVQSGPNSSKPHLRPTGRRLQRGDVVLLDFGAAFEGYRADTTRMAVVGELGSRQREVHRAVLTAHDAALEEIRAGVTAGAVDEAARKAIRAAGLGEFFIHRTGHGLGLEAHEEPSLDPGSSTVLEPGMVVTIEPGVYLPGWGGVRIEDDVVVEVAGARLLTRADRGLTVIGSA